MNHSTEIIQIKKETVAMCPVCHQKEHKPLYRDRSDIMFGASGLWDMDICLHCGSAYLNPRPVADDIEKVYTEIYAQRKPAAKTQVVTKQNLKSNLLKGFLCNRYGYCEDVSPGFRMLALLINLSPYWQEQLMYRTMCLPYKPNGRLLDIGCGNGDFLAFMSTLNWRAEGIDTDKKMIQICRGRGLQVEENTLEKQNYPDNTFDAITAKHVIEHVYDPVGFLSECLRILKPGGYLVLLTPNLQSLGHKLFTDSWLGLEIPRHITLFTLDSLRMIAQKVGLKIVSFSSTGRITPFVWRISYELKTRKRTLYLKRMSIDSFLVEKTSGIIVHPLLQWNKETGDELVLLATK